MCGCEGVRVSVGVWLGTCVYAGKKQRCVFSTINSHIHCAQYSPSTQATVQCTYGGLHGKQGYNLQQVVLNHIPDDAVLVKVPTPAIGTKILTENDLVGSSGEVVVKRKGRWW